MKSDRTRWFGIAALAAGLACAAAPRCADAKPMNVRVLQPAYALTHDKLADSIQWQLDELSKCDESLDLIVLPEASDRQGKCGSREESWATADKYNKPVLDACAATAKRCNAVVFVNAIDYTPTGRRNTTFAYDRSGNLAGKYDKEHLVASEWKKTKLDASYMWKPTIPKIVEIDGVRYAFLTCYDFYFYENYANIARFKPDVIIGCSHQRSDLHSALETFGKFLAYNTGAYLVRSSVSMGLDSPVGGCSMVVTPKGEMLGCLYSQVGVLDAKIDPEVKYLKPMGYGNPPGMHSQYIEIGRRPWKYRPAGPAMIPGFENAPEKRLCAHRGFNTVAPENSLAAFGLAVGLGAQEIEFDLWWTKDGEIVSIHDAKLDRVSTGSGFVYEKTFAELQELDFGIKKSERFKGMRILKFEDILKKFTGQTIMNIHIKSRGGAPWDEKHLKKVVDLIRAYDAQRHCYFMNGSDKILEQLERLAPEIPRCMGYVKDQDIVDHAIRCRCQMVQFFKGRFDPEKDIKRAHDAGLRCNLFWSDDPEEAKKYLDLGIDTILTNDYQPISAATGLK